MKKRSFPDFVDVARDVFSFLQDDYGWVVDRAAEDEETGNARVLFKNDTTFVDVHLERRDFQVIVYVGPLVGGEVPPRGSKWIDLGFVLLARGIPMREDLGELSRLRSSSARRRVLEEYADVVRLAADDLLVGDFGILRRVDEIKRQRRSANEVAPSPW